MLGTKIGSLTVMAINPKKVNYKRFWDCICICGNSVTVREDSLKFGNTKSCGCLRVTYAQQINSSHGESSKRLYHIWGNMLQRCNNPNDASYDNYGGRGITVCSEWYSYETFALWANANGYTDSLTIDRKDVNKSYSSDNCQWVSWASQTRNRRKKVNTSSSYTGIVKTKHGLFEASVTYKGKRHYVGTFTDEVLAAQERDALIIANGWDHKLNF